MAFVSFHHTLELVVTGQGESYLFTFIASLWPLVRCSVSPRMKEWTFLGKEVEQGLQEVEEGERQLGGVLVLG